MISLPKRISLKAGSIMEEWVITDLVWTKYLIPALKILPDLVNSTLLLWAPPVLLGAPWMFWVLPMETCRGRLNSDSCVEMPEWYAATPETASATDSSEHGAMNLSVQFQKKATKISGNRYFSNFPIIGANIEILSQNWYLRQIFPDRSYKKQNDIRRPLCAARHTPW